MLGLDLVAVDSGVLRARVQHLALRIRDGCRESRGVLLVDRSLALVPDRRTALVSGYQTREGQRGLAPFGGAARLGLGFGVIAASGMPRASPDLASRERRYVKTRGWLKKCDFD